MCGLWVVWRARCSARGLLAGTCEDWQRGCEMWDGIEGVGVEACGLLYVVVLFDGVTAHSCRGGQAFALQGAGGVNLEVA